MLFNFSQIPDSTINSQVIKDSSTIVKNIDTSETIKLKQDSTALVNKFDSIKTIAKDSNSTHDTDFIVKEDFIKDSISSAILVKYESSYKPEIVVNNFSYPINKDSLDLFYKKTLIFEINENFSFKNFTKSQVHNVKGVAVSSASTPLTDSSKTYLNEIKPIKYIDKSNHIKVKNADWFLGVLIVVLSIVTILKLLYSKYFSDSIKSLWSYQHSIKLFKENNVVNQRLSLISNILFILSFSLFTVLCTDFFSVTGYTKNDFLYFSTISGLIMFIYLIKYAVYKILGYIFIDTASYSEYLYNVFQFNRIAGIFLIPIIIALAYSTIYYTISIVYSGLIILFIVFIMRIIRGMQICIKVNFSIFYSFLYLCILEILPLIVIFKLIKLYIN
ncbi:MAG: hypothetical protein A2046_04500 [Bacteroidetes bacterium GWA2_30_7]|nr:MAG: hypothetical protein A2046_04500 [Bacteroidetes bacterium GWA2_30_7]